MRVFLRNIRPQMEPTQATEVTVFLVSRRQYFNLTDVRNAVTILHPLLCLLSEFLEGDRTQQRTNPSVFKSFTFSAEVTIH